VEGESIRDTLAVDMLSRGASPYDVAKMLGDTIDTVEKHYTPFVKELRDRVPFLQAFYGGQACKPDSEKGFSKYVSY
jgi:hypothetical protein